MSLLVAGGVVVTQDQGRRVVEGPLYVEEGRVRRIGGPPPEADRVLDASGCLVLPGLVDAFVRSAHLLLGPPRETDPEARARAEADLRDRTTKRDVGLAAALALADRVRGGVTCVLDLSPWPDEAARAAIQVGVRSWVAHEVREEADLEGARASVRELRSWEDTVPLVGTADTEDPALLRGVAALAAEEEAEWCASVAPTRGAVVRFEKSVGRRPVEWMEDEGLLSPSLRAVHCVWLTRNEIRALARGGVRTVHCPTVGLAGRGGLMPLPELRAEGVPVGLGSDSSFVGGRWDPLHLLRLCALLHRGERWEPSLLPAADLLDLTTREGARVLGHEGGRLEAGAPADLAILRPPPGAAPATPAEALAALVYGAEGSRVRHVVVGGTPVVEEGRLTTVDDEDLRQEVRALRRELDLAAAGG